MRGSWRVFLLFGLGKKSFSKTRIGKNLYSLFFRTGEGYSFRTGKLLGFWRRGISLLFLSDRGRVFLLFLSGRLWVFLLFPSLFFPPCNFRAIQWSCLGILLADLVTILCFPEVFPCNSHATSKKKHIDKLPCSWYHYAQSTKTILFLPEARLDDIVKPFPPLFP